MSEEKSEKRHPGRSEGENSKSEGFDAGKPSEHLPQKNPKGVTLSEAKWKIRNPKELVTGILTNIFRKTKVRRANLKHRTSSR